MRTLLILVVCVILSSFAYAVDTSDWMSHWTMDNNDTVGTICIDVNGTQNGTIVGDTVTGIPGIINEGYYFDGDNDYVQMDYNSDLDVNGWTEGSVYCWFNASNCDSTSITPEIIRDIYNNDKSGIDIKCYDEKFRVEWRNGASSNNKFQIYDYGTVNNDQWYFVVIVYNQSEGLKFYINGSYETIDSTGSTSGTGNVNNNIFLGIDPGYGQDFQGEIDECGIVKRALSPNEIISMYNSGNGLAWPFEGNATPPVISNVVCTSPDPDDTSEPYTTDDVTPTFTFDTDKNAWCRISDEDLNYSLMIHNCTGGEGTENHTCTLDDDDALPAAGTDYVHISCSDGPNKHNNTNNEDLEMYILGANETAAMAAIEAGINEALTSPTIYTSQQIYLIYQNSTQQKVRFDKVAYKNNQYWGFNYITEGEPNTSISNMGTTFIAWQNWSLTEAQIVGQVSSFINSSKK